MTEQASKSAKYIAIGAIIAALITGGVALFIHFDTKRDVSFSESVKSIKENKKENETEDTNVKIQEVFLTPVSFDIPATFFLKIVNTGLNDAKDFTLLMDFGAAKIEKFSIKPLNAISDTPVEEIGIKKLKIKNLLKDEAFYVSCFLSLPTFEKIVISGGNLSTQETLTFTSYRNRKEKSEAFWPVIVVLFGIPLGIYFMIVLMTLLNRFFKL